MTSPLNGAVEAAVRTAMMDSQVAGHSQPAVAGTLAGLYEALARHLEPIVSTAGVQAIYRRSVHLTSSEVPWIAMAADAADGAGSVTALRNCLAQQEPSSALDGARVLLVTFVDLLARLIGEGLTTRLVAQAWPRAFRNEPGQEAKG